MSPRTPCRIPLALALLVLAPALAPAAPPDTAAVDTILADALASWRAPGLAVAVVRDDSILYLKGTGVRETGRPEPVTADTLFGIGSCTKAFTAAALGILVDEHRASWDDPVRKHIPSFRLRDPLADRDVTLRDLLCHRTGLARHDLLWHWAPWSVAESVRRMAFLEPHHSFRAAYEYNNLAYLAAGLAVGSAAKCPWDEFVRQRIFQPLGMKGAVFTRSAACKSADHATPHHRGPGGKPVAIPWYNDDTQIRASGSIKAGVRDLSRWARLHLNGGILDGKRILSADALREIHTPQIIVPLDRAEARATGAIQHSYGLGFHVTEYRGHALLEHGGAVDGFRARILLLPRDHLGIVLLTNVDAMEVVQATGNTLMDHFLGLPKKDWHAHYARRLQEREAARKEKSRKLGASRHTGTKPSRGLGNYAGTYEEAAYGSVRIQQEGKDLVLSWSSFRVPLRHFHYNTFATAGKADGPLAEELAVFELDGKGDVAVLRFLGRKFTRKMH